MKTVTLEVASRDEVTRRALEALGQEAARAHQLRHARLLWKVLTAKRWEVLKAMAGQGPLTIREVHDGSSAMSKPSTATCTH